MPVSLSFLLNLGSSLLNIFAWINPHASSKQKAVYSSDINNKVLGLTLYICAKPSTFRILSLATKGLQILNAALSVVEQEHKLLVSEHKTSADNLVIRRLKKRCLCHFDADTIHARKH